MTRTFIETLSFEIAFWTRTSMTTLWYPVDTKFLDDRKQKGNPRSLDLGEADQNKNASPFMLSQDPKVPGKDQISKRQDKCFKAQTDHVFLTETVDIYVGTEIFKIMTICPSFTNS